MKSLVAVCAFSLLFIGAFGQTSSDYSYRGDIPGKTTYEDFISHSTPRLKAETEAKDYAFKSHCVKGARQTISCEASVQWETTYDFVDDKLASVSLFFNRDDSLAGFIEALTTKYGPPTEVREQEFQNSLGARLPGKVRLWKKNGSVIQLSEYGHNIYVSELVVYDEALAAEYRRRLARVPEI